MRPEATSNTNGSSFAICRLPTSGSYAGNMSSGRRQGPSRSMMLVMVTSPILSVCMGPLRSSQRNGDDAAGRLDVPALALEWLAGEPGRQPVGDQPGRGRPDTGPRYVADGMAAVGIDHQLARAAHDADHALGVLERAELIGFARDHEVGVADALSMALPGQRLHEGVELGFVGVVRHPH